jgi:hypothetical protein
LYSGTLSLRLLLAAPVCALPFSYSCLSLKQSSLMSRIFDLCVVSKLENFRQLACTIEFHIFPLVAIDVRRWLQIGVEDCRELLIFTYLSE